VAQCGAHCLHDARDPSAAVYKWSGGCFGTESNCLTDYPDEVAYNVAVHATTCYHDPWQASESLPSSGYWRRYAGYEYSGEMIYVVGVVCRMNFADTMNGVGAQRG
jgi:hypothetical protein